MDVQLKVRKEAGIHELKHDVTFKIPESSYLFLRLDVDGLKVQPKASLPDSQLTPEQKEELKPILVLVPEGKLPVVCLNTGRAQWMNANDKVEIVELKVKEIFREDE